VPGRGGYRAESGAVYSFFVRRRIYAIFDGLSRGDYSVGLGGLADDVHHVFAGEHALGGERHSRDGVRRWFERLFRLFELRFDVRQVIVSGLLGICSLPWSGSLTQRREPVSRTSTPVLTSSESAADGSCTSMPTRTARRWPRPAARWQTLESRRLRPRRSSTDAARCSRRQSAK